MQFNLNEMQVMLQDGARRLMVETLDSDKKREIEASEFGFSTEIWSKMSELGWVGAALPEAFGGGGLGMLDLTIVAEELGRAAVSSPLAISSGFAACFLQNAEQSDFVKKLLQEIASSDVIVSAALIDEGSRDERAVPKSRIATTGDGGQLSGTKIMTPFASAANVLLVSAVDDKGELVILAVDRKADGLNFTRHQATGSRPLFTVTFENVAIPKDRILAQGDKAKAALNAGLNAATLLATAEAVGNCEGMLHLSAEYAANREQFGVKIGSFQAVAHPLANMRIQTDAIRLLTCENAWMLDQGKDVSLEVSETKVMANEAIIKMVHAAHAAHGAIGYTMEYDLQLYTRRARAFCLTLGDTYNEIDRAATALGL